MEVAPRNLGGSVVETPTYDSAKKYTEEKLQTLRSALAGIVPPDAVALTCGSFARRDASPESDIDFFMISGSGGKKYASSSEWLSSAQAAISGIVAHAPAAGGAFAQEIKRDDILRNIGGNQDSNDNITRRMLYLLEGEWLTNEAEFREIRRKIIHLYVNETPRNHQLAFYLLNDVIRYWRTITVDYSNKTGGENAAKPWAIRNVKLVYSRKLLYASGLFSVAMTVDRTQAEKERILDRLFDLPVVERLIEICGAPAVAPILKSYDFFLRHLEQKSVREHLKSLPRSKRESDPTFRALKNESHHFSRELMKLFLATFERSHPIHMAVVF